MSKPHDDDVLIQIGILLGCEWSIPEIAQHLGIVPGSVYNKRQKVRDKDVMERVKSWTKVGVSKYIEARIKKAEDDLAERKKRLLDKGYRVIERTVDGTLAAAEAASAAEVPWKPDPVQLTAANMGIERTEGKPLDRKSIEELRVNRYIVEVDGSDLEDVLATAAILNEMRLKALPPARAVIDVTSTPKG